MLNCAKKYKSRVSPQTADEWGGGGGGDDSDPFFFFSTQHFWLHNPDTE